jgi:predicted Rossmann fold flavoprotein
MSHAHTESVDTVIIGAGAAGLMTAISAGQSHSSVILLEANAKPGMKILISGGGRCNFTNASVSSCHFVSDDMDFCTAALTQFTQDDFIGWVQQAGIAFYEKTLGQLFCRHSSKEIVHLLLDKLDGATCTLRTSVKDIVVTRDQGLFHLTSSSGAIVCRNVVIATGGLSFPQIGATALGYEIARQFGHTVTPLSPALDGFALDPAHMCTTMPGLSLVARVTTTSQHFIEELLFTHKGLSGPAALKASLYWHTGEDLLLDFAPQIENFPDWLHLMRNTEGRRTVKTVLTQLVPQRLATCCCAMLNLHEKKVATLSKSDGSRLEDWIKRHRVSPTRTIGYAKAEVTRGGVATHEIDAHTMESKKVRGLFFVGEVLDVTGWLGGYNFQWAWSSGWVAGQHLL